MNYSKFELLVNFLFIKIFKFDGFAHENYFQTKNI